MALTKVCSKCPEIGEQPIDNFPVRKQSPDGRRATCNPCTNKMAKESRERLARRRAEAEALGEPEPIPDPADVEAAAEPEQRPILETMMHFGSAIERTVVEALIRCGSIESAATDAGLDPRQFRAHLLEIERRAARRGWSPDLDLTRAVPQGFHLTGASTYYGADGNPRGQWVKSKKDPDDKISQMLDALSGVADAWKGKAEPLVREGYADDDLLCVYPMGDPHLGMYSWFEETGANFDLDIAETNLVAAVDHLVELAPPAKRGLIVNLGDFFHADNSSNQTSRSHHALDVDTRWAKVLRAGIRTMRRSIDRALEKHEIVDVICEIGNHDDHSAIMLALALSQYYEREPRVRIDTSPAKFHWYRFGDCLIGVTHGDTVKGRDLPGVMAHDRAKDWGETRHRHFYCGHVHHESAKEFPGVTVETMRTLAPRDAWHTAAGYRSCQDMRLDVWHRRDGRVNRHVVGIRQVWDRCGGVGAPPAQ